MDFNPEEWRHLLDLSAQLKAERRAGRPRRRLAGSDIALIFERTPTRTRCVFEVAAFNEGAHVAYLDPSGSQIGHKESVKDTARALGRTYAGIEFRGRSPGECRDAGRLCRCAGWNGLTDQWHPTQTLCDMLTMRENGDEPDGAISVACVGDARGNMGSSLLVAGAMMGMDVRFVAPEQLWQQESVVKQAQRIATGTGAQLQHTEDIELGVKGMDYIYTDMWLSMREPEEAWDDCIRLLRPYQVTMSVLAAGNPDVRFLHCLPSFHDRATAVGDRIYRGTGLEALEVINDVFESGHWIGFDQAENRMHINKAVIVANVGG